LTIDALMISREFNFNSACTRYQPTLRTELYKVRRLGTNPRPISGNVVCDVCESRGVRSRRKDPRNTKKQNFEDHLFSFVLSGDSRELLQ
jgi:hypothetical protein